MKKSKIPSGFIRFNLSISSEKYLAYYKGHASYIHTSSIENKSVRFPASAIRKFLTHEGIYGFFEIQYDENNKLIQIVKIN